MVGKGRLGVGRVGVGSIEMDGARWDGTEVGKVGVGRDAMRGHELDDVGFDEIGIAVGLVWFGLGLMGCGGWGMVWVCMDWGCGSLDSVERDETKPNTMFAFDSAFDCLRCSLWW